MTSEYVPTVSELRQAYVEASGASMAQESYYAEQVAEFERGIARIKAEAFCQASGLPTVADDSGLCVEALGGAPGVYSARYCGRHGDDPANNRKLLQNLANVPEGARGAKFVSAVCVLLPGGACHIFLGECPGRIGFAEQGTNGFGYDPLFIPDRVGLPDGSTAPNAQGRTYAQLADGEKDAISHRGRAMAAMAEALPQILAGA